MFVAFPTVDIKFLESTKDMFCCQGNKVFI